MMEPQDEALRLALMKCDLPAERHLLTVVLGSGFLENYAADRPVRHCHGHYEVQFQWSSRTPESGSFRIIPPGVWHTGVLRESDGELQVTSLSLTIREKTGWEGLRNTHGAALEAFLRLSAETPVPDTFGGARLLQLIRQELQQQICPDRIYALLHLLLVELALHLPCYVPAKHGPDNRQEDWMPECIERFLNENFSDPSFSRERMAQRLNYSERQLGRVLEQIYGKSFRQILLERRMEFAEAWRVTDKLSAAETARKVGYTSVRGFCNAYEKYHGRKYKEETG